MALTTPTRAIIGTPQRPYRRGVDNAILGGVCGGLAIRLGVKERRVRIAFSILALLSGLGILLYSLLWLTLARSGEDQSIAQRLLTRHHEFHRIIIGTIAVVAAVLIVHSSASLNFGIFTGPVLFSLVSAVGIWRGASMDERQHLRELFKSAPFIRIPTSRSRKSLWLRIVVGAALIFFGLRSLSRIRGVWGGATSGLFASIVLIVGILILLAPWWLATLNDLSGERRARVRVEERANVAAHLHDSVLQTLTLIERAANDETAVVRLARNQERELRRWLFDPDHPRGDDVNATFATLMHSLENEIENDYGVKVELVLVGDVSANDDVVALVAAGREAAINAARWAQTTSISIFAEVEAASISLFVRDQGKGFDTTTVPDDRRGIALSIRQRVLQHGGTVSLRSTAGVGTDVELTLPRTL